MTVHSHEHPLAGQTVRLGELAKDNLQHVMEAGEKVEVIDWWDRYAGTSWKTFHGFISRNYESRMLANGLPDDAEVVLVRKGRFAMVHNTELALTEVKA